MKDKTRTLLVFGAVGTLLLGFTTYKLIFSGHTKKQGGPKPNGPLMAEGFVIRPLDLSPSLSAAGSVLAMEEAQLRAEVPGRLVALHFNDGTFVKQGTLLAELYSEEVQAEVKKAEAQLTLTQSTAKRTQALRQTQNASEQELEEALAAVKSWEATVDSWKAKLAQTRTYAPFDGVVSLRQLSVGTYLSAGTDIVTLRQMNPLKIDFFLPAEHASHLSKGQTAFWEVEGEGLQGTCILSAIEPAIDIQTRNIKVRAMIPNPPAQLLPGHFVRVSLPVQQETPPLMMPSHGLVPEIRGYKVWKMKDGTANPQPVTIGFRNDSLVEIREGLLAGDTILLSGLLQAKPGQSVQFSQIRQYAKP
jgi:membrane fusion protein (multidrug efflux system)